MSAKITFQDVYTDELAVSKINFGSFNSALSFSAGLPLADSVVGALYINTSTGDLYRKTASGGSNWAMIGNTTGTAFNNQYRTVIVNAAVTSGDMNVGDLVGIFGVGAWSASGNLNGTKNNVVGAGSQNAAICVGGIVGASSLSTMEIFTGSTWSVGSASTIVRSLAGGCGSQNAAIANGGLGTSIALTYTELFNGATWSSAASMSFTRQSAATTGAQFSAITAGGTTAATDTQSTEAFNGTSWNSSPNLSRTATGVGIGGTMNAAFIAGSSNGLTSRTEIFNGTSWSINANMNISKGGSIGSGGGSQNAGFIAGGTTGTITAVTELFNGSAWIFGANMPAAREAGGSGGSQNSSLIFGGITSTATASTIANNQTTYRKLYSKYVASANKIGILNDSSTVILEGKVTGIIYPINKYMILNRYSVSSVASETTLGAISFQSVLGTAPTMTYNFSSTSNILSVMPGMVVSVSSSGANPVSAGNVGTFVISRVVSPSSIEVTNVSGISQNPGTGTLNIISTILAVDNISPQDIVIGKTDSNGNLFLSKPPQVGSMALRLK